MSNYSKRLAFIVLVIIYTPSISLAHMVLMDGGCLPEPTAKGLLSNTIFDKACGVNKASWLGEKLCGKVNPFPSTDDYVKKCFVDPLSQVEHVHPKGGGMPDKNFGEPHIVTRDGLRYGFQAQGDYALIVADGLEVQARYTNMRGATAVRGVAVKMGGTVVVIEDSTKPSSVWVNGVKATLNSGDWYDLESSKGVVQRLGDSIIIRTENTLDLLIKKTNLEIHLNQKYAGKTQGLQGNGDGDPSNDLRTANGDPVDATDPESLYGQFMLDWRREAKASLFPTPFQYIGDPNAISQEMKRLSDIDPAKRKIAFEKCRAAGLKTGAGLDECTYDLAITGDDSFIDDALFVADSLKNTISATALTTLDISIFSLENKASVSLGMPGEGAGELERSSNLDRYTLTVAEGDKPMLVIAKPCGQDVSLKVLVKKNGKSIRAYPLQCNSPIALPHGNIAVDIYSPAGDLSEYEFEITGRTLKAATASLELAGESLSGNTVSIDWQGPNDKRDYISVASKDMTGRQYHSYTYTREGSPLELRMPDQAGEYEVRYIQGQSNKVLTKSIVIVQAASASLEFDNTIKSGSELTVNWIGPNNRKDYLSVADKDMTGRQYHSYTYTRESSPLKLRMPDQAGEYEVRYIHGQSNKVLTKSIVIVQAVSASLEFDNTVKPGSELTVNWTGPNNRKDYLSVADKDMTGRQYHSYTYTREGSPLKLRMPDQAGEYEVRYIQGGTHTILVRHLIIIEYKGD